MKCARNTKTCKAIESRIQIQFKSNDIESLRAYHESKELLIRSVSSQNESK